MRPILFDVDHDREPPTMTVLLIGRPHRLLTFEIRRLQTRQATEGAAMVELAFTDRAVFEVAAVPMPEPS
jgi:hypothetical protein